MKLLKVVFVILLLVTLGEVGYYLYLIAKQDSNSIFPSQNRQIESVAEQTPQIVLTEEQTKIIDSVKQGSASAYLNNFKNTSNRKVSLIVEQTGFIGDITHDKTNGNVYLKIFDDKNQKIVTFILNQTNLPNTTFYKIESNKQIAIGIDDVKTGDKIVIRIIQGITDNTNRSEFFIYEK